MTLLNILQKVAGLVADNYIVPKIKETAETFWSERV